MVFDNPAFIGDDANDKGKASNGDHHKNDRIPENGTEFVDTMSSAETSATASTVPERGSWGNDIEFLMSCIAMSVGLGNVWRFPFTALENGGGAFLIPYLIVLLVVGRPIYYLEMIMGQFSSRGSAKVYDLCPAMRGAGYGQVYAVGLLSTYYASLMALIVSYLIDSFRNPLPWTDCQPEWPNCVAASATGRSLGQLTTNNNTTANLQHVATSDNYTLVTEGFGNWSALLSTANGSSKAGNQVMGSSEFYFIKEVLNEADNIDAGIGLPDWKLSLFLLLSWLCVLLILIRGVKSSGKASYFLALFPYVVMGILLVRAVTLPGAADGILYFVTPQWDRILDPDVWYAAVTQCFFSLSVCFGNIIMYSSYNRFGHNIYRDATVVTLLDTFTSMIAGCTIFGILGNLAHQLGTKDIQSVVKGGASLAFVSYPDAIAKFDFWPQGFSVLFFFMLFVLGVGSNVAMTSCVMTVIRDQFPRVKLWQAALGVSTVGFCIGLVYVTPGGQFVLGLVDFFGASFIAFVLAIAELAAISWFYGVDRLCKDVEFMIGRNPGVYWRICWGIITPLLMLVILLYTFITYKPITYKGQDYPDTAIAIGWLISSFGIIQLPIWACVAIVRQPGKTCWEKVRGSFRPMADWGPSDPTNYERYRKMRANQAAEADVHTRSANWLRRFKRNIFG